MAANNDALAMTEHERRTLEQLVAGLRRIRSGLTTREQLLVRASEHIEALDVRNLNFGNAYRELEARVTAVAEAAWAQGYEAHRTNPQSNNPYTQTHSTEEN